MNNEELQSIILPNFPVDLDEKIFISVDEDGEEIGEPYSYNEFIDGIIDISGLDYKLLGEK